MVERGEREAERHRCADLYGDHAGGHVETLGVTQHHRGGREGVDAGRLADPARVVAARLGLARGLDERARR
jgi:hypothetical protein